MAIVRIPAEQRTLRDFDQVVRCLAGVGIDYERWEPAPPVSPNSGAEDILAAYAPEIEKLKERGGYVTADVIDVRPETPGLDQMLVKFNREHWHDEDEVRFIISGRGLFHVRPRRGSVVAIQVEAGDLIRVPWGTWHWFDLCGERCIRAVRLFRDPAGWVPNYTASGAERGYEPVCLGPAHIPLAKDASSSAPPSAQAP